MKKLLVTLLVLGLIGGGGFVAYRYLFVPEEQRACQRLAELCSGDDKPAQQTIARCEKGMAKLKEAAGDKQVTAAAECISSADSCMKAAGCVFGAGIGAMGEFIKGVGDALKKSLEKK